jgi:hypothetical protein
LIWKLTKSSPVCSHKELMTKLSRMTRVRDVSFAYGEEQLFSLPQFWHNTPVKKDSNSQL